MARVKYCEKFEYMWSRKPERSGPNSKANAYKAWNARITDGYTEREMVEGLRAYGKHCATEGKLGSSFVMQMQTFFGPALHFEADYGVVQQPMELEAIAAQKPKMLREMSGPELRALDNDTSWATGGQMNTVNNDFIEGETVIHQIDRGWAGGA